MFKNNRYTQLKSRLSTRIKIMLYSTLLVPPHINYCVIITNNQLQKRATRMITLSHYYARTDPLCKHLNLLEVNDTLTIHNHI